MRKTRRDKKFITLRTADCCTCKHTYMFKSIREAKKYWRDELNNSGDYNFSTYTLGELLGAARDSYELREIELQA